MKKTKHVLLLLPLLLLFSCQNNPYLTGKIDKNINITFERFDRDFHHLNTNNNAKQITDLQNNYGEFFSIYNQGIIRLGDVQSPQYESQRQRFRTDSIYCTVYDTVQHYFPDLATEEELLTAAFRNYHLIFPKRQIPQCYTHISGFNTPIVVGDSILSVSLENYLGADHVFYKKLSTYTYLLPRKNRENIPYDAIRGWLISEFPTPIHQKNLLNNITQEGKLLFIQQVLMPQAPPHLILGLTPEQYAWCEKNEKTLWKFMIEQQHLFSTQQTVIAKYLQNGPFFNFFGQGSSPLVGKYIGWQIVKSYMNSNKATSIEELIKITQGQELLQVSDYKP